MNHVVKNVLLVELCVGLSAPQTTTSQRGGGKNAVGNVFMVGLSARMGAMNAMRNGQNVEIDAF